MRLQINKIKRGALMQFIYESTDNAELFIFCLLQVSALPRRDPLGSRKKDSTAAR